MYGAQTTISTSNGFNPFENDVEMYGAQTTVVSMGQQFTFENDVEMYGAQTKHRNYNST